LRSCGAFLLHNTKYRDVFIFGYTAPAVDLQVFEKIINKKKDAREHPFLIVRLNMLFI